MKDDIGHSGPRVYANISNEEAFILTFDFEEKIRTIRICLKLGHVKEEYRIFSRQTKDQIIEKFEKFFPGMNFQNVDMNDLSDDVLSEMLNVDRLLKYGFMISTCPEFSRNWDCATLNINRLIDEKGVEIGRGPRPGEMCIDQQIEILKQKFDREVVVLLEDGVFSGTTIKFILDKLEAAGIEVGVIAIGFAFKKALDKIKKHFKGKEIIVAKTVYRYRDWLPDHDFFPFVPNSGKVVGVEHVDGPCPLYDYHGSTLSVPYIMPFLSKKDMHEWTCIPEEECEAFSIFCLEKSKTLFAMLGKEKGREIRIDDLIAYGHPRISIPYKLKDSTRKDNYKEEIVVYLERMIELVGGPKGEEGE